jgi:hypothetical protein
MSLFRLRRTDGEVVLASLEAIIPAIEGGEGVATENDDAAAIGVA